MEALLSNARDLCSRGKWTALCDVLDQSRQMLSSLSPDQLDSALDQVSGSSDSTLLWLALLTAKFCRSSLPEPASDWVQARRQFDQFVGQCNGELVRKHRLHHFSDLCSAFSELLLAAPLPERVRRALAGVGPMRRAVGVAVGEARGQLSTVHVLLCRLCLVAQCPRPALHVLNSDITEIGTEAGRFSVQHLLLYYYYGGIIYAALGQHERAAHFLEIYYMVPASAVSSIMVEAFKKHVLLTLILSGQSDAGPLTPPARYHEAVRCAVVRRLRPLCPAYVQLADAFSSNGSGGEGSGDESSALETIVTRHRAEFERDNNWGLVRQCVTAHRRRAVQRLTRSFVTLSLHDAACRVGLADCASAENHVRAMIGDGGVCASIDARLGMVRFLDRRRAPGSGLRLAERVRREMSLLMLLHEKVHALDVQLRLDQQYVAKSGKRQEEETAEQAGSSSSTAGYEAASSSRPLYNNLM